MNVLTMNLDRHRDHLRLLTILLFCLLNIGFGVMIPSAMMAAGGGIGLCYVLSRTVEASRTRRAAGRTMEDGRQDTAGIWRGRAKKHERPALPSRLEAAAPIDLSDTNALVEQMLAQTRYALLLRRQIAGSLGEESFQRTLEALRQFMALVPGGDVSLRSAGEGEEGDTPENRVVRAAPFFLDRYPVTNQQYYEFLRAGGYQEMALWDQSVWPAILDMVDQTGMPGPRYWQHGCFAAGEEDLPVVGVCWYEASACARWLGKRLPTDAEWVKAACWPVVVGSGSIVERRYPWGDLMDHGRANLWGSGPNRVVPVDEFPEGVSVSGVYQMVGNVWEWTSGSFRGQAHAEKGTADKEAADGEAGRTGKRRFETAARRSDPSGMLGQPLKSIRGGAFDTYFDNQAAAQFQSGDNPLGRRANIGFRCALGMSDIVLARPTPQPAPEVAEAEADPPRHDAVDADSGSEVLASHASGE